MAAAEGAAKIKAASVTAAAPTRAPRTDDRTRLAPAGAAWLASTTEAGLAPTGEATIAPTSEVAIPRLCAARAGASMHQR